MPTQPENANPKLTSRTFGLVIYKAIIATTATIPANTLPPRTFSWLAPSLSAPLLVVDPELEPLPWLNPPLPLLLLLVEELPVEAVVAVDAEETEELLPAPWLSTPLFPLRPGTVSTDEEGTAPEAVPEGAPALMSVPVPRKDDRTVGSLPSTTVSLVPA
jgi:hypothetical protein